MIFLTSIPFHRYNLLEFLRHGGTIIATQKEKEIPMNPKRRYIAAILASALLVLPAAGPAAQALEPLLAGGVAIDASTFPDSAFRSWLLDGRNLSGAGADSLLTADELAAIQSLDLSGLGITDLEGIQVFTALKRLNVRNNALTALDLSANTALTSLDAGFNRLTELDLSDHPLLRTLNCQNNRLTSLDLTGAEALVWLYARSNQLPGLDLSDSTALEYLDLFENKLASIDLSMLPALRFLHIRHSGALCPPADRSVTEPVKKTHPRGFPGVCFIRSGCGHFEALPPAYAAAAATDTGRKAPS